MNVNCFVGVSDKGRVVYKTFFISESSAVLRYVNSRRTGALYTFSSGV
jgi:hypothetical protein